MGEMSKELNYAYNFSWMKKSWPTALILGKLPMNQILERRWSNFARDNFCLTKNAQQIPPEMKLSRNYHKMLKQQLNLKIVKKSIVFHNNILFYLCIHSWSGIFVDEMTYKQKCWWLKAENSHLSFEKKLAEYSTTILARCVWNSHHYLKFGIRSAIKIETSTTKQIVIRYIYFNSTNNSGEWKMEVAELNYALAKGREISISHARETIFTSK